MPNPDITFEIGKLNKRGRSVRGRVSPEGEGYKFEAHLYRWVRPDFCICNKVNLSINRPFDAFDFAFFAHMVSIAHFETNSRDVGLRAASRADLPSLNEINRRFAVAPGPGVEPSEQLLADISCLEDQLGSVRDREALQLALPNAESSTRSNEQSLEDMFARVPIAFFTVLVKREFVPPGGLMMNESSQSTSGLSAFVFMNGQDLDDFLSSIEGEGVVRGQQFGVADMMAGPLVDCDGIDYVWDEERMPPCWTAFRVPADLPD